MGLHKGQCNNLAGRPVGIPNRTTKEMRQKIKDILSGELENLPALLSELRGKERAEIVLKLMNFIVPKAEPVNYSFGEKDLLSELEELCKQGGTA